MIIAYLECEVRRYAACIYCVTNQLGSGVIYIFILLLFVIFTAFNIIVNEHFAIIVDRDDARYLEVNRL